LLSRPKTVRPDSLAQGRQYNAEHQGVKDTKSLTDGERTVELRRVRIHMQPGCSLRILPAEKVLFVSDLYTPGAPVDRPTPAALPMNCATYGHNRRKPFGGRIVGGMVILRQLANCQGYGLTEIMRRKMNGLIK